jgi:SlyX protein
MIEIETKLAHQEYTIAEFNDALSSQQLQISNLELMVTALRERIKVLSEMAPVGSDTDEVPPHY